MKYLIFTAIVIIAIIYISLQKRRREKSLFKTIKTGNIKNIEYLNRIIAINDEFAIVEGFYRTSEPNVFHKKTIKVPLEEYREHMKKYYIEIPVD